MTNFELVQMLVEFAMQGKYESHLIFHRAGEGATYVFCWGSSKVDACDVTTEVKRATRIGVFGYRLNARNRDFLCAVEIVIDEPYQLARIDASELSPEPRQRHEFDLKMNAEDPCTERVRFELVVTPALRDAFDARLEVGLRVGGKPKAQKSLSLVAVSR